MSNELTPFNMGDEHKAFVIKELASNTDPLVIKERFDRLFAPATLKGESIFRINEQFKDEIKELRYEIYSDLSSLPFSFEWTRIAFAQSRIQYLLENPKYIKSKPVIKDGNPDYEDVKEIDEAQIRGYLDFCRQEAQAAKKMALEKILNKIDRDDPRLPAAGFKPIEVNVGFTITSDEEDGKTE